MYDKRSAWALAAIAPGAAALGRRPTLADVAVAVQSELPTSRARLADVLWAVSGQGAQMETIDLLSGERWPRRPSPSRATTLAHGFATISKFFPGTKEASAWLEERLFAAVVGEHAGGLRSSSTTSTSPPEASSTSCWSATTASSPICARCCCDAAARRQAPGAPAPRRLCARPYDLCTALHRHRRRGHGDRRLGSAARRPAGYGERRSLGGLRQPAPPGARSSPCCSASCASWARPR